MAKKEKEEWRQIPNVDGYEVSSLGRVRSQKGKIIKQWPNKRTRLLQVMTYGSDGRPRLLSVGRQVALAFLGPPPYETAVARHISLDIQDNRVENITWGDKSVQRPRTITQKYTYIIRQMTQSGLIVCTYRDWDVLTAKGYKRTSVTAAAHGRYRKNSRLYKGYFWEVIKIKNDKDAVQA